VLFICSSPMVVFRRLPRALAGTGLHCFPDLRASSSKEKL
jgi:hypothetical protein